MESDSDLLRKMMLDEVPVGFVVELMVPGEGDYELSSNFPFDAEMWALLQRQLYPLFAQADTRPKPGNYVLCYGETSDPRLLNGGEEGVTVRQVMRVLIGTAFDQVMQSLPAALVKMRRTWDDPESFLDPMVEHALKVLAMRAPRLLERCELALDADISKRIVAEATKGRCALDPLTLFDQLRTITVAEVVMTEGALRRRVTFPALCNYPVADASVEALRPRFEPILQARTRAMAAKLACTLPGEMPRLPTLTAAIPRLQALASYYG